MSPPESRRSTNISNMASVISLGIVYLLTLQVYGRPSLDRNYHLANYGTYRGARNYNGHHLSGVKKDDDSSSEVYSWKDSNTNGHSRKTDLMNSHVGVTQENARDDSMFSEQFPPVKNGYKNKGTHRGEVRTVDSKENDDNSSEGFELRLPNHEGKIGSRGNGNDDSEYSPLEEHRGGGHQITDGILWAQARGKPENLDDDSAANEEGKMAKFRGRGNALNQRIDDLVGQDIFHKRGKARDCLICCIYHASNRCPSLRAHGSCPCFRD